MTTHHAHFVLPSALCDKIKPEFFDSMALSQAVHRPHRPLLWIVLTALAVRILAMFFLYGLVLQPQNDHFEFGWETGRVARAIATGDGISSPFQGRTGPTAFKVPVYPFLIAGVFKLAGVYSKASALIMLTLQDLISALTCVPIFLIGMRTMGPRVALWAGWTWAVFPYSVYIANHDVGDPALSALLLSLLFLFALKLEKSERWRDWLGFGLLAGFSALTNPALLSPLPLLGGWVLYRRWRSGALHWEKAGAAVLVLILSVTPWFVRNYKTFGVFIPFRSNFWLEVRVGNSSETDVPWRPWLHPAYNAGELARVQRMGELPYMVQQRREALQFIAAQPGTFASLTVRRVFYFWSGIWNLAPDYLRADVPKALNFPLFSLVAALALGGLSFAFERRLPDAWPFACVLATFPLVYYVTAFEVPYRHPLDPLLVLLCAYAVSELVRRRAEKHAPKVKLVL
jgi:4-amino-4-deoxy-L-arabinose transferase-like glycosyltransferase